MKLLFDKSSARSVDAQGFMHVADCNISKANVCPYRGAEIPDWQGRCLDPEKIYWLLRTPEELAKAAPTFNNLPLLDIHVEVGATDFLDPEIKRRIVGSTGTDAAYDAPYLKNSLVIWTAEAIAGIESREQVELSCAYRYDLDMTPGEYEGKRYDGRMKDIIGNHVALVKEGRAGKDVVVADAAMACDYIVHMPDHKDSEGKDAPWVIKSEKDDSILWSGPSEEDAKAQPGRMKSFAKDDKPMDEVETLTNVKASIEENMKPGIEGEGAKMLDDCTSAIDLAIHHLLDFKESQEKNTKVSENPAKISADSSTINPKEALMGKPKKLTPRGMIAKDAILALISPKLAKDADLDLEKLEEIVEKLEEAEEKPMIDAEDPGVKLMEILGQCNLPEDVLGQINDLILQISGNKPKVSEDEDKEENDAPAKDLPVTKPAMDAALQAAERSAVARVQAIFQAAEDVAPIVGKVNALAADSAASIYKMALDAKGIDTKGVDPSAYRAMVMMIGKPAETPAPRVATDKAMVDAFDAKFPTVKNVKKL